MENRNTTRFIVQDTSSQVARRPRVAADGAFEIFVTRHHCQVFMYIARKVMEERYHPNYREIQEFCGYKNPDSALRAVRAIAKIGLLRTDVRRARSIQLTPQGKQVFAAWDEALDKKRRVVKS